MATSSRTKTSSKTTRQLARRSRFTPRLEALEVRELLSNLITNGDFEAGNSGFSTAYRLSNPIGDFGTYAVTSDPFLVHDQAASFGDHTSGAGLMAAFNGPRSSTDLTTWSQTVPVNAQTNYTFSTWVASWTSGFEEEQALLEFSINGVSLGVFRASTGSGVWENFTATWNSGANTSASIRIVDINAGYYKSNDFTLDDISLVSAQSDLAATSLAWNATRGGVDFSYAISGANLTQASTAALYWSADATFDASQDTLIPASVTTTQTAIGAYPVPIDAATLGQPTQGAKYLLAVVDPGNTVAESDEPNHPTDFGANNVKSLQLPDIALQGASWLSVENGGGISISYFVRDADLPLGSQIQLYWSADTALSADDRHAAAFSLDTAGLTSRDDANPKTIQVTHARFIQDAAAPRADEKYLLIDTNSTIAPNPIIDSDSTNDRGSVKIVPLVLNIVTHGFNPAGLLKADLPFHPGWSDFWTRWDGIGKTFDDVPVAGSILEGRVKSYVPKWDSSEGFYGGFVSLLLSKLDAAAVRYYRARHLTRPAARFLQRELALEHNIAAFAATSKAYAEQAASDTVKYILDSGLLLPPDEARGVQHIHLVGHSRGAAVNARVSKLLTEKGYFVDQFTSLDGYSTDWPTGGGRLGDISIVGETFAAI